MNERGRICTARAAAVLERTAGQLFDEQGYACTSIVQITDRADVDRDTFFTYFAAKSDLLWCTFDIHFTELADRLEHHRGTEVDATVRAALAELAATLPPMHIALAFMQTESLDLRKELRGSVLKRIDSIGLVITRYAVGAGISPMHAEVAGTAYAGCLLTAVGQWARLGTDDHSLTEIFATAAEPLVGILK